MRTSSVVVVVVGLVAVVAVVLCWPHTPSAVKSVLPMPEATKVETTARPATPAVAAPAQPEKSDVVSAESTPVPKAHLLGLRVPPEFADFESWNPERQINAVTDIQRNQHLSPAMRDFLVDLASDPSRRPLLRNNAANALGAQDPPVPGWLGKLADQALDPAESPLWRDYALQHLSDQLVPKTAPTPTNDDFVGSPDSGLNRSRYIAVLTAVASGKLTVAGTALLHLDRLSKNHAVDVSADQIHALVLQALENPDVAVGTKVTAFGILGMRKNPEDAVIARRSLKDPQADVRRAAVAALGNLGNRDDIASIEAVETGGDRTVEMAKTAACKRLAARSPQ